MIAMKSTLARNPQYGGSDKMPCLGQSECNFYREHVAYLHSIW